MLSGEQVATRAEAFAERGTLFGSKDEGGMCLRFARTCVGAPAAAPDAATAWRATIYRHTSIPPRGALVWWSGGSRNRGHVAIGDGKGFCWSTDIARLGRVDRVSLAYLAARWGNLRYLGWSEDVNGVRVAGLVSAVVSVQLHNLRRGLTNPDVRQYQLALRRAGFGGLNPSGATGHFGAETEAMTRRFQMSEPGLARAADGVPGPKTAALLGLHVI